MPCAVTEAKYDDAVRKGAGSGLRAHICHTPNTSFLEGQSETDDKGYVRWTKPFRTHTSVEGVFAACDITQLHSHQISAAVHEGAQAASAANYYLYPPEMKAE